MRRSFVAVSATLALGLGLSGPASAAGTKASCQGLAASSFAGQPGARASDVFDGADEAAQLGITAGALRSQFAQNHLGTAEACWDA
jgi:hypothetical protein